MSKYTKPDEEKGSNMDSILGISLIVELLAFAGTVIYSTWWENPYMNKILGTIVVLFVVTLLFSNAYAHKEENEIKQ